MEMTKAECKLVPVAADMLCSGCAARSHNDNWFRLRLAVPIGAEDEKRIVDILFCASCAGALGLRETKVVYYQGLAGRTKLFYQQSRDLVLKRALELEALEPRYSLRKLGGEWRRVPEEEYNKALAESRISQPVHSAFGGNALCGFRAGELEGKIEPPETEIK